MILLSTSIILLIIVLSSSIDAFSRKINNEEINVEARAFEIWNKTKHPFPCVSESSRSSSEGIFYIGMPHTGSKTLINITKRFSGRESMRQGYNYSYCKTHLTSIHTSFSSLKCANRTKSVSFLWTVIRHPNNRAMSHHGILAMFGTVDSTDENFISELQTHPSLGSNFQLNHIVQNKTENKQMTNEEYSDIIQNILDEYNFIGIYERLDESLVVLSMIMGMGISDVLYYFRPSQNSRCESLESEKPSWLTSGMREYLESDEWKQKQEGDFILYDIVNKTLDATIEKLGRLKVKENLANYKRLAAIGTRLSNIHMNCDTCIMTKKKDNGCGVLFFPTPYSDINELKFYNTLDVTDQNFVYAMKAREYFDYLKG